MDGLVSQIVYLANVTDGAAAGTHEDGMGDGLLAGEFDAGQERTIADAGGAEDRAVAAHQIVHGEDAGEVCLAHFGAEPAAFGVVARPAAQEHAAAESLERRSRQHAFGRAADPVIQIHSRVRQRRRDGGGDVPIADQPQETGCDASLHASSSCNRVAFRRRASVIATRRMNSSTNLGSSSANDRILSAFSARAWQGVIARAVADITPSPNTGDQPSSSPGPSVWKGIGPWPGIEVSRTTSPSASKKIFRQLWPSKNNRSPDLYVRISPAANRRLWYSIGNPLQKFNLSSLSSTSMGIPFGKHQRID